MNSPILFINRWFGIFPYKFISIQMEFCPVSALIGVGLSIFMGYTLHHRLTNPDDDHPEALTNIVSCLFDIVTVTHSCFTWTVAIFWGKSYRKIWALRRKIDNFHKIESNSLGWIFIISFIFFGSFLMDWFSVYHTHTFSYWCAIYLPLLIDLCINWNYGFWMEYLVRQLMFLNQRFKFLVSGKLTSCDRIDQLQNLSRIYFILFDLSVELNNIFGSHVIYFFIAYGMSFALNMYHLSIGGYSNHDNPLVVYGAICWTFVRFIQLFSITVYCDCVNTQFAQIKQNTSLVWKIAPVLDRRLSAQVFSFSAMISCCPIVSSVGETFQVGYSPLFTMIVSVVTNSVIFAQAAKLEKN